MHTSLKQKALASAFIMSFAAPALAAGPEARSAGDPVPSTPSKANPTAAPSAGSPSREPAADPMRAPTAAPTTPGTTVETATGKAPSSTLSAKESRDATKVLTDIHKTNALEITLGRLAEQKAQAQPIKDYAQHLVTDHQAADKKVMDFASANSLVIAGASGTMAPDRPTSAADIGRRPGEPSPTAAGAHGTTGSTGAAGTTAGSASDATPVDVQLDAEGKRAVAKLEKLEGAKFEKAFLTEMVKGHTKTAAKLKSAEQKAVNPDYKSLVGEIRTTVEGHLEKAKELQRAGSASLSTDPAAARPL